MNGASLFGHLKRRSREKRAKNALNPLILFVDSTFLLIYSHRYIEQGPVNTQASPRIFSKKGGGETNQNDEVLIAACSSIKLKKGGVHKCHNKLLFQGGYHYLEVF